MKIHVMLGTVFLTGLLSAQAIQETMATPAIYAFNSLDSVLTEAQKVERLLEYIRGLEGATFIRNGSEHSCKEAADHLEAKWKKHMSKIRTAEGFITELASASGMTGDPYKIKFADGTTSNAKEVLLQELKRLDQQ